jgi:hypothetical protein
MTIKNDPAYPALLRLEDILGKLAGAQRRAVSDLLHDLVYEVRTDTLNEAKVD